MTVTVHHGNMLNVLQTLGGFHACVTDPPYHLTSIVKRFGAENAAPARAGKTGAYARASAGFMGQRWDGGDIAFRPETWRLVYDALLPGAHLVAFGAPRAYHRMACAIEDAGFEVRDSLMWLFGSGFPKSHNLDGDWQGWGTALKPAYEPIILARKPLVGTVAANVLAHGTGAINIDACRVGEDGGTKGCTAGPSNGILGDGLNGAFGQRVDGLGRWPANVVHDGSDEVVDAFPFATGQQRAVGPEFKPKTGTAVYGDYGPRQAVEPRNDAGSAARFFYTAKADAQDRLGSKHPTVKPVDLMRWLVRLVTPQGGTVLDPFAGSGTTGMACLAEGFDAVLIEREAQYVADIRRRIAHVSGQDAPLFAGAPA